MDLKKLFEEHETPSHCCKKDIHSQLGPILGVGASAQKQMIEYRTALMAELLDDDSEAPKLEHFDQTFAAAERLAAEFVKTGRELALTFTQLDRYVADEKNRRAGEPPRRKPIAATARIATPD